MKIISALFIWVVSRFCSDAIYETASRIFRDGPVYFGGIAHWIENPHTGVTTFMSRSWPELPFALYPIDDSNCLTELREFWLATQNSKVKAKGFITVAMRWFSLACEVNRLDDRLINLMISIEALSQNQEEKKLIRYPLI